MICWGFPRREINTARDDNDISEFMSHTTRRDIATFLKRSGRFSPIAVDTALYDTCNEK